MVLPNMYQWIASGSHAAWVYRFRWQVAILIHFSIGSTFGGAFSNLDFDAGTTNGSRITYASFGELKYPFGTGLAEQLFPGWTIVNDFGPTNLAAIGNDFFEQADVPKVELSHASLLIAGDYRASGTRLP